MEMHAGTDASEAFQEVHHGKRAMRLMEDYCIGKLESCSLESSPRSSRSSGGPLSRSSSFLNSIFPALNLNSPPMSLGEESVSNSFLRTAAEDPPTLASAPVDIVSPVILPGATLQSAGQDAPSSPQSWSRVRNNNDSQLTSSGSGKFQKHKPRKGSTPY